MKTRKYIFLLFPVLLFAQYSGYDNYGGYITESVYAPEASALFARMTTQPDATRKTLINNLIVGLKNAGIWSKLDLFYMLASHDEQSSLLNWISSSYDLTKNNNPIFTIDKGWKGDGVSGYLSSSYTPATDAINYTLNNADVAIYVRQTYTETKGDLYIPGSNARIKLITNYSSGYFGVNLNDLTLNGDLITMDVGLGLFEVKRANASNRTTYHNGININTRAVSTTELPEYPFYLMKEGSNYTNKEYCMVSLGSYLTNSESSTLFNLIETYLDAIGAGVVN